MDYPELNFPPINLRYARREGKQYVFDTFRSKWVVLTPEEWVRQHVAYYLNQHLGYPKSLISIEKQLKVNKKAKRWDVLCADKNGAAFLLVECKEPGIAISKSVFHQAMRYNLSVQAPYLFVTNGLLSYSLKWDGSNYKNLNTLPAWGEVSNRM